MEFVPKFKTGDVADVDEVHGVDAVLCPPLRSRGIGVV